MKHVDDKLQGFLLGETDLPGQGKLGFGDLLEYDDPAVRHAVRKNEGPVGFQSHAQFLLQSQRMLHFLFTHIGLVADQMAAHLQAGAGQLHKNAQLGKSAGGKDAERKSVIAAQVLDSSMVGGYLILQAQLLNDAVEHPGLLAYRVGKDGCAAGNDG